MFWDRSNGPFPAFFLSIHNLFNKSSNMAPKQPLTSRLQILGFNKSNQFGPKLWDRSNGRSRPQSTQTFAKYLKERIKPKYGETPTSWSLRKLHKSGTQAKPSLCRADFLLVPKTANGWIACISREKCSLSLSKNLSTKSYWILKSGSHVFPFCLFEEDKHYLVFVLFSFNKFSK